MSLLAHPPPQFRLRTILDMYEFVVEVLDCRNGWPFGIQSGAIYTHQSPSIRFLNLKVVKQWNTAVPNIRLE